MADATFVSGGWGGLVGVTVVAYPRARWAGTPPLVGQRAPASAVADGSGVVGTDGFVELSLPEDTAYYLGEPLGRRWLSCRTPAADVSVEAQRAEAAELRISERIEEVRSETPGAQRLIFGMNSNRAAGHASYWTGSRVLGDRSNELDMGWNESPAEASAIVRRSLEAGCKYPLIIFNCADPARLELINAAEYAAGVVAIVERVIADHPTVKTFELINEPYYKGSSPHGTKVGSNASTYGAIVAKTYEAAKTAGLLPGVTLLVSAFGQYNSLSSEETQTQSGVFKQWIDDVCTAMRTPYGMVVGDATPDYPVFDSTETEREEGFQFTARRTGPVKELRLRTSSVANTGVSSVKLGICADNAGKQGAVLGEGTRAGEPGVNEWLTVSLGSTVFVTAGVKYWLAVLPLGTPGKALHYWAAHTAKNGTLDQESKSGHALATIAAAITLNEWESFDQGPVGFMAGVELDRPLSAEINGWSNHPYGTLGAANGEGNFNWGSTEGFRSRVSSLGAGGNGNWWLTEFGWKGEAEQNANMAGFLEKALSARQAGWLTAIYAYDDGDGLWTLYSKPAGEALRVFAAAHG